MKLIKWLNKLLFKPAAFHCKPLLRDHEWQAPENNQKFPVCIHCGQSCWWLYGYTFNSGTYLPPDIEAQKLILSKPVDIPNNSMP